MLKTTVKELNNEIVDKNESEEQMRTTIVTQEELVDKLSMVIKYNSSCVIVYMFSYIKKNMLKYFDNVRYI